MAIVDRIWFHDNGDMNQEGPKIMRVYVKMHPAGEVMLKVEMPEAFYQSVMRMANAAAETHEAEMQAQLLGEKYGS